MDQQQIKRRLAYQNSKDKQADSMDNDTDHPLRVWFHKLTGVGTHKPRQRSAVNTWRKTKKDAIENALKEEVKRLGGVHRDKLAVLRDKVAKSMFSMLPDAEKAMWESRAKEEQKDRLKRWETVLEDPTNTDPKERQR